MYCTTTTHTITLSLSLFISCHCILRNEYSYSFWFFSVLYRSVFSSTNYTTTTTTISIHLFFDTILYYTIRASIFMNENYRYYYFVPFTARHCCVFYDVFLQYCSFLSLSFLFSDWFCVAGDFEKKRCLRTPIFLLSPL